MPTLWPIRAAITLIALLLAAVHVFSPVNIDAITLALLLVAAFPWLHQIFKSVELPGIIKIDLQELQQEVKDIAGAAQSAERKADLAVASSSAFKREESLQTTPEAQVQFDQLTQEYDLIRKMQQSGSSRTQAMTTVVRRMIDVAPLLKNINVLSLLRSTDDGVRLGAYAYLYAQPHSEHFSYLVDSVTSLEDKPFGQYWVFRSNVTADSGRT